jgi:hypothetical protein
MIVERQNQHAVVKTIIIIPEASILNFPVAGSTF